MLKNALDTVYGEWNNKAAAFVGYGSAGGSRAIEHLRLIAAELQMATVRQSLTISTMTDFENRVLFTPHDYLLPALATLFDQLVAWSNALRPLRGSQ